MTKEEAMAFKARWELASTVILEELRRASPEERLRQLASLFGLPNRMDKDEERVRALWLRLKNPPHV